MLVLLELDVEHARDDIGGATDVDELAIGNRLDNGEPVLLHVVDDLLVALLGRRELRGVLLRRQVLVELRR